MADHPLRPRYTHHPLTRDTFNNAWLSGSQSLVVPGVSAYRLPLWTERLVGDLRSHITVFNGWRRSIQWLASMNHLDACTSTLAIECDSVMDSIPYRGTVPGFGSAVNLSLLDLSLFLSGEWLNNEMINAGADYILRQLNSSSRQCIANSLLVSSFHEMRKRSPVYSPRQSSELDHQLAAGRLDKIYVPLHISDNHWTLLEIDIPNRTFAYGDSLNSHATPPKRTITILECLSMHGFVYLISAMAFLVVLSCSAHLPLFFSTAILTPEAVAANRMEWFLHLSERLVDTDMEITQIVTPPPNTITFYSMRTEIPVFYVRSFYAYNFAKIYVRSKIRTVQSENLATRSKCVQDWDKMAMTERAKIGVLGSDIARHMPPSCCRYQTAYLKRVTSMVDPNITNSQRIFFNLLTTMTQHQSSGSRTRPRRITDQRQKNLDHDQVEDDGEHPVGDNDWEDEEVSIFPGRRRVARPVGSASAYTQPSPRNRPRPASQVKGSRKQIPTRSTEAFLNSRPTRPKRELRDHPLISQDDIIRGTIDGGTFVAGYSLDVLAWSLRLVKVLFFVVLMPLLLGTFLLWPRTTIQTALAPTCALPSFSNISICTWTPPNHRIQWADYPRLVEAEIKTFDQLMGGLASEGGGALSLEVKHVEMTIEELVSLIRVSDLKAKDVLASLLSKFISDAKKTGWGLQKLSSKVDGAIDSIMAVNDYALKSIKATRTNEPSRFIQAVTPWRPKRKPTDVIVVETFEEATNVLSLNLKRLILEAQVSLRNLQDLEERLNSLHEILLRENTSMTIEKDSQDVLTDLWTKFGTNDNNKKLRNFESHLKLLKDLAAYRKQALTHVVAALQSLRGMSEDMEDMRERVAKPNLLATVPVEVHMESIEMGLQRLKEGRLRAEKLEVEAMDRVQRLMITADGSDKNDASGETVASEEEVSITQPPVLVYVYKDRRVVGGRKSTYQATIFACLQLFPNIPQNQEISLYTTELGVNDDQLAELPVNIWPLVWNQVRTITIMHTPVQPVSQGDESNITLHFQTIWGGGNYVVRTAKDSSIASVLDNVIEAFIPGACHDSIRLIYEGLQLVFEPTKDPLSRWQLQDNSTIHVVPRIRGGKPVIYLFSPTQLDATVQLSLVPQWELSAIYPVVPIRSGSQNQNQQVSWNVRVHPNGDLTELTTGLDVCYLFWEALTNPKLVDSPPPLPVIQESLGTETESFIPNDAVLTNENAVLLPVDVVTSYLDTALNALGLHTEARTSFITYWLPSLLKHKHIALRFLPQAAYEKAAPLDISPKPHVVTRIFMLFRGVKEDDLSSWSLAQLKSKDQVSFWVDRVGVDVSRTLDLRLFRVIEWGGMELSA